MDNWWEEKLKGIPKPEELSVQICDAESRLRYVITIDSNNAHKLYKVSGSKAVYTKHKSINPLKLEKFISNDCSSGWR